MNAFQHGLSQASLIDQIDEMSESSSHMFDDETET